MIICSSIFLKYNYLLRAPGRYGSISASTVKGKRYRLSSWNKCRNSFSGQQAILTGFLEKKNIFYHLCHRSSNLFIFKLDFKTKKKLRKAFTNDKIGSNEGIRLFQSFTYIFIFPPNNPLIETFVTREINPRHYSYQFLIAIVLCITNISPHFT